MESNLLQLIKDRIPSLEENEVAYNLLDYFLKESYSSKVSILTEKGNYWYMSHYIMAIDDILETEKGNIYVNIYNSNNIDIAKTNEEIGVEEDIRFNIIDNNSFDIFYCNYDVNGNKPLVKSFNLSFLSNKLSSAVISEWDFSREMEGLLPYISNILAIIKANIDYYKEVKQLIDRWSDENIIAHYEF